HLKFLIGTNGRDGAVLATSAWEALLPRSDQLNLHLGELCERELNIIQIKGLCADFVLFFDLTTFTDEGDFGHVGRGSGANSMVAYCLGITNVDPIELDLYFERFLNPERSSPPDFDIDFSWDNRDAVYEYLFEKYGKDHVCLLGTHVTYQRRSV